MFIEVGNICRNCFITAVRRYFLLDSGVRIRGPGMTTCHHMLFLRKLAGMFYFHLERGRSDILLITPDPFHPISVSLQNPG